MNDGEQRKRSTPKKKATREKVEFKGYVPIELTPEIKAGLSKYDVDPLKVWDWIEDMGGNGYQVKNAYDFYNQCYMCSIYAGRLGMSDAGWTLTLRANDPYTATVRAMFVHEVVFEREWDVSEKAGWDDDQW